MDVRIAWILFVVVIVLGIPGLFVLYLKMQDVSEAIEKKKIEKKKLKEKTAVVIEAIMTPEEVKEKLNNVLSDETKEKLNLNTPKNSSNAGLNSSMDKLGNL